MDKDGNITLDNLNDSVKKVLGKYASGNSGVIKLSELTNAMKDLQTAQADARFSRIVIVALVALLLLTLGGNFGLTYYVVQLTREMKVEGSTLENDETGEVIRVASAETVVSDNGVMVLRATSGAVPNATQLQEQLQTEADDPNHLGPGVRRALAVRTAYQQRRLSSTMPDGYFKELSWLEIQSDSGSTVSMRITAIGRISKASARCGSLLILHTPVGRMLLDEEDATFDDGVGQLLEDAGVELQDAQGVARRVLRRGGGAFSSGVQRPRRLQAGGGARIVGFFNIINDEEWRCESVIKPTLPPVFSASTTLFARCLPEDAVPLVTPSQCEVTALGVTVPAPGVVTEGGVEYLQTTQALFVSGGEQVTVSWAPYQPGMAAVRYFHNATRSVRDYSIRTDGSGELYRCHETVNQAPQVGFSPDMTFQYLGEVEGVPPLRRFRLSTPSAGAEGTVWQHTDYFEDADTGYPASLLTEDILVRFDGGLAVGAAAELPGVPGLLPTEDAWQRCLAVTNVYENAPGLVSTYLSRTSLGLNATAPLQGLWDVTAPFPPPAGSPAALDGEGVRFYANLTEVAGNLNNPFRRWLDDTLAPALNASRSAATTPSRRTLLRTGARRRLADEQLKTCPTEFTLEAVDMGMEFNGNGGSLTFQKQGDVLTAKVLPATLASNPGEVTFGGVLQLEGNVDSSNSESPGALAMRMNVWNLAPANVRERLPGHVGDALSRTWLDAGTLQLVRKDFDKHTFGGAGKDLYTMESSSSPLPQLRQSRAERFLHMTLHTTFQWWTTCDCPPRAWPWYAPECTVQSCTDSTIKAVFKSTAREYTLFDTDTCSS